MPKGTKLGGAPSKKKYVCKAPGCKKEIISFNLPDHYKKYTNFSRLEELKKVFLKRHFARFERTI